MTYDHSWLVQHIPHQGDMCLLDAVLEFDAQRIRCRATSHHAPTNPLRAHGRLGAVIGIEYAAQAMAAHGALLAATTPGAQPRAGYLTSARAVECMVTRLDDITEPLLVEAERLSGDENNILYTFALHAADRTILRGRAAVVLDISAIRGTA